MFGNKSDSTVTTPPAPTMPTLSDGDSAPTVPNSTPTVSSSASLPDGDVQPTVQSLPGMRVLMRTPYGIRFPPDKDKAIAYPNAASTALYRQYKDATTTVEFRERGGTAAALAWDLKRGICVFTDPEMEKLRQQYAVEHSATRQAAGNLRLRGGSLAADSLYVSSDDRALNSKSKSAADSTADDADDSFQTNACSIQHTSQRNPELLEPMR